MITRRSLPIIYRPELVLFSSLSYPGRFYSPPQSPWGLLDFFPNLRLRLDDRLSSPVPNKRKYFIFSFFSCLPEPPRSQCLSSCDDVYGEVRVGC